MAGSSLESSVLADRILGRPGTRRYSTSKFNIQRGNAPYNSVIGLEVPSAVRRFVTGRPGPYKLGEGNVQVRAVLIDVDDDTGKARSIERLTLRR